MNPDGQVQNPKFVFYHLPLVIFIFSTSMPYFQGKSVEANKTVSKRNFDWSCVRDTVEGTLLARHR